jgi:hypothetical protein
MLLARGTVVKGTRTRSGSDEPQSAFTPKRCQIHCSIRVKRARLGAQSASLEDQQERTVAVLNLDDCECAVGVDRVPPGASLWSLATVSIGTGDAAAQVREQ